MNCARNLYFDFEEVEHNQFDSLEQDFSFESSSENLPVSPIHHYGQSNPTTFINTNASTPRIITTPCSPPYKRVRALNLFDTPLTPKTIIKQSAACVTPNPLRTRLFHEKPRDAVGIYPKYEKPIANVNPFTPNGLLLNKKRTVSIRSLGSPILSSSNQVDSDISDLEIEQPTKRVALHESNISRYHEEFLQIKLIGSGQFGSVYKCINRLDGCTYAIKKSTRPVAGSSLETRALNEVYAHAVLGGHQHVVRYYSAWAENDHMIIQNEYCNGGSLAERIATETLSILELRRLIMHVAEGLQYIHSEGLVHLDIKPANIFISREKKVVYTNYDSGDDGFEDLDESSITEEEQVMYKIGDLGHVTGLVNPQVEEGDCRYLSKEVLQEDYSHLTKADVFALGLTVLEAAGSGPLPKNGEQWHKIRNGEIPPLKQCLNRDLLELVKSMINPNPTHRPTPQQILHHRALTLIGKKSKAQLHREVNALKLKNEILSKQLLDAVKCIQSITPENKESKSAKIVSRIIKKNINRSLSSNN